MRNPSCDRQPELGARARCSSPTLLLGVVVPLGLEGLASMANLVLNVPGVGATTDVMTTGMTPGLHGIHIHDFGDLSDTVAGTSTGPHYNPLDEIHGCYPTPPGEVPGEVRPSPAAPSGCAAQRAWP